MENLAFFELPPDQMPKNLQQLQTALEGAGLRGEYSVMDDMLIWVCEGDRLLFNLVPASSDSILSTGPGIEVTGEVEDIVATLIDLTEILQEAFPGCRGSTAYEDEL